MKTSAVVKSVSLILESKNHLYIFSSPHTHSFYFDNRRHFDNRKHFDMSQERIVTLMYMNKIYLLCACRSILYFLTAGVKVALVCTNKFHTYFERSNYNRSDGKVDIKK